ncbi:MAG: hypothetical protein V1771_02940 [Chloroflexota bacterium]
MQHLGEGEERKSRSHNIEMVPCCEPRAKQVDDAVCAGVTDELHAILFVWLQSMTALMSGTARKDGFARRVIQ